ncbi:MAG: hypothetical protein RR306_00165 [Clostridia bacterium]
MSCKSFALEPMVFTSLFISWIRKSSFLPIGDVISIPFICSIWLTKRTVSSFIAVLSAKIAASVRIREESSVLSLSLFV